MLHIYAQHTHLICAHTLNTYTIIDLYMRTCTGTHTHTHMHTHTLTYGYRLTVVHTHLLMLLSESEVRRGKKVSRRVSSRLFPESKLTLYWSALSRAHS